MLLKGDGSPIHHVAYSPDGRTVAVANMDKKTALLDLSDPARPTLAIGRTKRLFEHAYAAALDAQLALEARMQQESVGTADFAEGVGAFLEKRAPSFTGT